MADVQPLRFFRTKAKPAATPDERRVMTPLQAEFLEDGWVPDPDALGSTLTRHDLAIGAGYGDQGPVTLPGPESAQALGEIWPPVLQWEIDPGNPDLESGEADVTEGDWDFAVWWQRHPDALLYVSIQALERRDDEVAAGERQLPMGRNVVVNLVYDERRSAVVAIYGTARDFRPFISALRTGLGLRPPAGGDV